MADEREQQEARSSHSRTIALLRDLGGDCDFRMDAIINQYYNRNMDDMEEDRAVRSDIRGALDALQRRIEQTINSLR